MRCGSTTGVDAPTKRDTNWTATKAADERFARSVELLGNEADQVRVGALHALAWLADSTPRYKQTVLDVLCAYLRRPFTHPSYTRRGDDPEQVTAEDSWGCCVVREQDQAGLVDASSLSSSTYIEV